jgi:hypothetical protein
MTARRHTATAMLLVALPATALAQREPFAPLVLLVPATPRITGLGGAVTAVREVDAIFANPALVGVASGTAVSYARFSSYAAMGAVAASSSLGTVNVGLGVQFLDFQAAALAVPVASRQLTRGGVGAGASFAAGFALNTTYRGLRWGAAAKYVEDRVSALRGSSAAFDLGVSTQGQITYALAVQNLGPAVAAGLSRADLPRRVSVGASRFGVPVGPFDVGATVAVSLLRRGFVAPAAGMEWAYTPLDGYTVAVRAGVRRPELREQQPFAAGASVTLDRVSLDYAAQDLARGVAHYLAFRLR